jgi:hypothetical protein
MTTENEYSWIRYIKNRIKRNKNFLCIISGATGSGKSWTAMSIAEMLNDDFNADRVIFKGKDLMKQINSGDYDDRKGVVFIWDEAGVDLSSRNWQSITNKMLNYLIQTFRHQNFILIFTSPYADFLDSSTRKLFHAEFETVSIDRKRKTVKVKPKQLQYNAHFKKWYRKYLIRIRRGMGSIQIKRWNVPRPSEELIKEYENRKKKFTAELNRDIETSLGNLDARGKMKKEIMTDTQIDYLYLYKKFNENADRVAEFLGTTAVNVRKHIRKIKIRKLMAQEQKNTKKTKEKPLKPNTNPNLT